MKIGTTSIFNKVLLEKRFNQSIQLIKTPPELNPIDLLIIPGGTPIELDSPRKDNEKEIIRSAVRVGKRILSLGEGTILLAMSMSYEIYIGNCLTDTIDFHPSTHILNFNTQNETNIFYKFFRGKEVVSRHIHVISPQRVWGNVGATFQDTIEGIYSRKIISCLFHPEYSNVPDFFRYIKEGWEDTSPQAIANTINLSELTDIDFKLAIERISGNWR